MTSSRRSNDGPGEEIAPSTAGASGGDDHGRCRDLKWGRVDLTCELEHGHIGWHRAVFTHRQEIAYPGARHIVETSESVTWEPVDHVAEAVRHLTKGMEK